MVNEMIYYSIVFECVYELVSADLWCKAVVKIKKEALYKCSPFTFVPIYVTEQQCLVNFKVCTLKKTEM